MKIMPLQHLVPCLAAVVIALAASSAPGQDCAIDGCSGYAGDLGCDNCAMGCSDCGGGCNSCGMLGRGSGGMSGGMTMGRGYGRPDLFYNYFTQGYANQVNAQMYLSPVPVPPNVGHTFFTYQPFYPHHMMYPHKDRFHRYYDNGRGMNRTRAVYYSPPVRQAASNFYWNFLRLPR